LDSVAVEPPRILGIERRRRRKIARSQAKQKLPSSADQNPLASDSAGEKLPSNPTQQPITSKAAREQQFR
jgi:hypothetical protein